MAEKDTRSPMMVQYDSIKANYPNEVVFFRLGDFYEMFNEDAVEVSRLLNLTLTHRAESPMCGIPYHAAKIYIARLLRLGKKIVICEQIGDPKAKGLTERKVVEVITPGTAVETEYLDGYRENNLAALSIYKGNAGFAFIDVSTSRFFATSWKASQMAENFSKEIARANPREFILPQSLKSNRDIQTALALLPNIAVSYYPDWDFNPEFSYKKMCSQFGVTSLKSFSLDENDAEVVSAGFLLDYLDKTTNTVVPHVKSVEVYKESQYLVIDDSSRRNLEITENMRDGSVKFSLMECLLHTKTAMGSRLLRQFLCFPLTKTEEIKARQKNVETFFENPDLMDRVRQDLSPVLDVERLTGRIAMEKAHAKDLQALRVSLENWNKVQDYLKDFGFHFLPQEESLSIIKLIGDSILPDPATSLTEGGIIKPGFNEELDSWRNIHNNFNNVLASYEEEEREKTGISTLKIKYTNAAGYFIEVSKGKLGSVPVHFIQRKTLVNGERYTTEKLQELEHKLVESTTRIFELERDLFLQIRNSLMKSVPYLLKVSQELAFVDVSASFAYSASAYNWVKPIVDDSKVFEVQDGRHPVVELHLPSGEFIPNDTMLSSDEDELPCFDLITGPNMAGKSTYLRQNALIVLLAQIGSFVPASYCRLGIVDKIFCRVGASDNLARGESTFLVEMTETANILRQATEKSLVIMDEVGRGTSTEDGLSIAQAVSEHLLNNICCRTFFATHYHELTRLEHKNIRMLFMDVSEEQGTVVFLRKVREGAAQNSYGIHVAKLAGVPQTVTQRAEEILAVIRGSSKALELPKVSEEKAVEKFEPVKEPMITAPGLFSDEEIILDEILSADVDNITPFQALQLVSRWKKQLSGL